MPWSCVSSRWSASIRFSIGGCVENSVAAVFFTLVGTMKNAFMGSASRRARVGARGSVPALFKSAADSALGRPVMMAAPRSAANSR